jgi:hypothetical protein
MFPIRHSASLAAIVLGAATLAFASEGQQHQQLYTPTVTHVGSGMARAPGRIEIQGTGLGLIQEVRLDDVVMPVVRSTPYSLWIEPGPQDPGFGKLELFYPRGVLTESLTFAPTLVANHKRNVVELTIDNGASGGFYALSYSLHLRSAQLAYSGIYYMDFLDMSVTRTFGLVGAEFFRNRTATEYFHHEWVALWGRPVYFQSLCVAENGDMCYSNPVMVRHGTLAPSDPPTLKM